MTLSTSCLPSLHDDGLASRVVPITAYPTLIIETHEGDAVPISLQSPDARAGRAGDLLSNADRYPS